MEIDLLKSNQKGLTTLITYRLRKKFVKSGMMQRERTIIAGDALSSIPLCRWSIAVMLSLYERPMRFLQLANSLGVSNKVLSNKLSMLSQSKIVYKDENKDGAYYRLTSYGEAIAESIIPLTSYGISPLDIQEILRCKWMRSILKNLWYGDMFATTLMKRIDGITWKVLSERLKKLEKHNLVERRVIPSHPIRIKYRLTGKGRALVRWMINNGVSVETHKTQ